MRRGGLGRGLDTLLPAQAAVGSGAYREVPVEDLSPNPDQPRRAIPAGELKSLTESIRSQGVLEPLVVSEHGDGFRIVAGERRWRAARAAGLATVPVVIRKVAEEDLELLALVENLQREDLSPLEEAAAFRRLSDGGMTHEEIARQVGRSRAAVTNSLRLLDLPAEIRELIGSGGLSAGGARALSGLEPEARLALAREAARAGMSVRQIEGRVRRTKRRPPTRKKKVSGLDPNTSHAQDQMERALGLEVRIQRRRGTGGSVRIRFDNEDDLHRIFEALTADTGERE